MAFNLRVVKRGGEWELLAVERDSRCLLNDFLNKVSQSHEYDFSRLQSVFDRLSETGPLKNQEVYKPLRNELFEIKVGVLRILCFQLEKQILCTHGFIKSSQKTPIGEIRTANWLRGDFLTEHAKAGVRIIED